MNGKKSFAIAAGFAALALCLSACGGGSSPATTSTTTSDTAGTDTAASTSAAVQTKQPSDMTVGFVAVGPEGGYRTAQENDIKAAFQQSGINFKYSAPTSGNSNDQQSQIAAFSSFVNSGVDAILLDPTEASGWEPSLQSAQAAGIPVILVDRSIEPNNTALYTAHIGVDGVAQSTAAATAAVAWAKNKGGTVNGVELDGPAGLSIVNDRANGWAAGIQGSNITMLGQPTGANWDTATAKTVMTGLLQKNSNNIQLVFAQNDEMAVGAIQAIQAAGLTLYPADPNGIYVIGIDATADGLNLVLSGQMALDVETPPNFGAQLVTYTEAVINGQSIPQETFLPFQTFDQALAQQTDIPGRGY